MKKTLLLLFITFNTIAQFSTSNPVAIAIGNGYSYQQMIDDEGNFVVIYKKNNNILIQKLDSQGNKLWGNDGITVCNREGNNEMPRIALCKTSSNSKRYIVIWKTTFANPDKYYAQSLDNDGVSQWATNGIEIVANSAGHDSGWDMRPILGLNKIVFAFGANNNTGRTRLQVLNVDNGSLQFPDDGLVLGNISTDRWAGAQNLRISIADDNPTILNIFWTSVAGQHSYVNRFNTLNNTVVWNTPLRIATIENNNDGNQEGIIAIGNYVAWSDKRHRNNNNNWEIYVQRIQPNKTVAWEASGKRVTNNIDSDFNPRMVKSNSGIYLSWDSQNNVQNSHTIMKIDSNGSMIWGNEGLLIDNNVSHYAFTPTLYQQQDTLTTFYTRSFTGGSNRFWAQRLSPEGRKLWGENGQYIIPSTSYTSNSTGYPEILKVSNAYILGFHAVSQPSILKTNPCAIPPQPPTVNNPKLCFSGASAKLKATNCAGIVQWYADDRVTLLNSDSTFTVSNITQPVSYFAACVDNTGCASVKLSESKITIPENAATITTTYTSNNTPVEVATVNSLVATNMLESSARVTYISKNIQLETGFHAKQGSVFSAIAQNCSND